MRSNFGRTTSRRPEEIFRRSSPNILLPMPRKSVYQVRYDVTNVRHLATSTSLLTTIKCPIVCAQVATHDDETSHRFTICDEIRLLHAWAMVVMSSPRRNLQSDYRPIQMIQSETNKKKNQDASTTNQRRNVSILLFYVFVFCTSINSKIKSEMK